MHRSLSDNDITDYVLNELPPRERLYVESMMLGCDRSREDIVSMMELSRLLEEGMENELLGADLTLDEVRRQTICHHPASFAWRTAFRVSATVASLAACVAFSVAAPVISKFAFRPSIGKGVDTRVASSESTDMVDPAAFPVVVVESEESDEFPTHVLLPTGAVNIGEMPLPYIGSDAN
jgi:anti-sigma factor RsiW